MHGDPRNTSCAEDRASKVSFLMDKSEKAASDGHGGLLPECSDRIGGIQDRKNMLGLLAPRNVNGNVVTDETKKRHGVKNKWRRLDR